MSHTVNVTVPYVELADFDWSFTRTGPLPWNQTVWSLLAVFTALPIWMTIELAVWVFYTFKRYSGLYFWSILVCTFGTSIRAVGFILKDCVPECNWVISTTIAEVGWASMVTGFSLVLYSRLHLIPSLRASQFTLRIILAIIITDALILHIPTIVFQYGISNSNAAIHDKFLPFMVPMEKVQVLGFSVQETAISAIYIYATVNLLRGSFNQKIRRTTIFLIIIQVVVILVDVVVIALDYCEYYTLKAVVHSFIYALKLQLEFVILNQFRHVIAKGGLAPRGLDALELNNDSNSPTPLSEPSTPKTGLWASSNALSCEKTTAASEGHRTNSQSSTQYNSDDDISRVSPNSAQPYMTTESPLSPTPSSIRSSATLREDSGRTALKPAPVRQSSGKANALDLERQYLGTWQ
ncbi:hypothetical protein BP5796_11876 [Coleophoma crateriformis]|uniref:DUF7703 domain-containing protein n=1 Tax=Coleophoma crateriformis TaxID=565419 RepID=A0A3D8QF52_9HELO|nr:hypothetical protein BP5796_11876 [Coleophoma crateriformis]